MWGYMEGPPVIGWVAGLSRLFLGSSVWAAKLPVLLVGLVSIYLLLQLIKEFGGGRYAQLIGGLAWTLSPVFLGSNYLFQPVSFNQFGWLLIVVALVRVIKYTRPKDWYILGGVTGFALLTKYSVVFYLFALLVGLLLSPQRKLLLDKHLWRAAGIALVMWLPNLIWQYSYDFPVVSHMEELASTQLVNMSVGNFLAPQFLFHAGGVVVWLAGLYWLLRSDALKEFRAFGWAYLVLIALLLALSGKSYYAMGAYPVMMAAGGLFWEEKLKGKAVWLTPVFLLNVLLMPFAIPILPVEQMKAYGVHARDNYGFTSSLRWEDGTVREIRQDYADMHGWEEMVAEVAKIYHALPEEQREKCFIYGGNYGQAGALDFYRKKYDLPEPVSYNASFLLWAPDELDFDRQIAVEDYPQDPSEFFLSTEKVGELYSPNARDTHYIYYYTDPSSDPKAAWREEIAGRKKARFGGE